MECENCPLQRTGEPASESELLPILDCTDCKLTQGQVCPPETTAFLVAQVRQLLQKVRQQTGQLKKARNEVRELRDQARLTDERIAKLEALQKASTQESDGQLRAKMQQLAQQHAAILALSTPIIHVKERTLVLPLIGHLDDERAANLTHSLLDEITRSRAQLAIIDLTGVPEIDAKSARNLLLLGQAVRLLGSEVLLCGLRPEVARALVGLDSAIGQLRTARSLREALRQ